MQMKLNRINDLLTLNNMLLSMLLKRTENRDKSRIVLTDNERDILNTINSLKAKLTQSEENEINNSKFDEITVITK